MKLQTKGGLLFFSVFLLGACRFSSLVDCLRHLADVSAKSRILQGSGRRGATGSPCTRASSGRPQTAAPPPSVKYPPSYPHPHPGGRTGPLPPTGCGGWATASHPGSMPFWGLDRRHACTYRTALILRCGACLTACMLIAPLVAPFTPPSPSPGIIAAPVDQGATGRTTPQRCWPVRCGPQRW